MNTDRPTGSLAAAYITVRHALASRLQPVGEAIVAACRAASTAREHRDPTPGRTGGDDFYHRYRRQREAANERLRIAAASSITFPAPPDIDS